MNDDKIKLGVLWKNVTRQGNKPYLSGRLQADNLDAAVELLREGGRFLILGNTKRPNKKDPDCLLFVVPERDASGNAGAANAEPRAPQPRPQSQPRADSRAPRVR